MSALKYVKPIFLIACKQVNKLLYFERSRIFMETLRCSIVDENVSNQKF